MEDTTPLPPISHEVYIPQKLKAYMSEPQGSAVVAALEAQYHCVISVINDLLSVKCSVSGMQADVGQIENILRDMWQKRDIQVMIREAALNVSCTHTSQMVLPRAYCAVVFFFSSDITRRSRCSDIIIDHFIGKVTLFGTESAVNKAREVMMECLTDHFGLLEIEIPTARRTTRMGYGLAPSHFNPEVPPPKLPVLAPSPFLNNIFSMGEPNAILSSTPPPPLPQAPEEAVLSSSFERQLQMFPSDFSVPPPQFQTLNESSNSLSPLQKTNNVEKVKQWIPTAEVGKILGNRAAMKKQIEGQYNCVITVHTEVYSHFGMTSVEIMAQNKEQCRGARNAVLSLLQAYQDKTSSTPALTDSGVNSPSSPITTDSSSTTPEKRSGPRAFHRSSFRDQPKVILELTPRKVPPTNE